MEIPNLVPGQVVADKLGIHINTLKRIPQTDLPFYRVTRRGDRRYDMNDVRDYLLRSRKWKR
jgi:uncharacterized protein YcsI (UPF0317 family)